MNVGRQTHLLRHMRRSLIALKIQTPQPVLLRIPVSLYYCLVLLLTLLVLFTSTRAVLVYRADVVALNRRIVSVERINSERSEVRKAALIAYQKQQQLAAPESKPNPAPIVAVQTPVPKVAFENIVAKPDHSLKPAQENRSAVVISVSEAEFPVPKNIDEALFRLQAGRDDKALRWAVDHVTDLQGNSAWDRFRHHAVIGRSPEQHYQLGVLFGALQWHGKSQHWLASAINLDEQARYLRAYAISVDRQGLQSQAIAAYWRYLNSPQSTDSVEIRARISRLENHE